MQWYKFFNLRRKEKSNSKNDSTSDSIELPLINNSIVHHLFDAACLFNYKGNVITYNSKLQELLGINTIKGGKIKQELELVFQQFQLDQAMDRKPQVSQANLVHRMEHEIPVSITHIPISFQGSIEGSFCLIQSVENSFLATESQTNVTMDSIINNIGISIWLVDVIKNKKVFVSDSIEGIYDIPAKDVTADTIKAIAHPDDFEEVEKNHARLLTEDKVIQKYRIITPIGKMKWIKETAISIRDKQGDVARIVGYIEDITKHTDLQQQLQDIKNYDDVTGLPNVYYGRSIFNELISDYQGSNKQIAMLYINVDEFNRINSAYDFDTGDEVIKTISSKVNQFIGNNGYLFRLFGDEWVATILNGTEKDYAQLAQTIIDIINEPLHIKGYEIHLTASVGISIFPQDGGDSVTLFRRAHAALKRAKRTGRNNYQLYSTSMNIETFKLLQLENDLRKAIDNKELYLLYQPKVDVKTQKATSAEALLRWEHPTWGLVSPKEFIPIAEDGTLFESIGDFVINSVCQQASEWKKQNIPFEVLSFNLSTKDLLKSNLAKRIKKAVVKYGVSPSLLEIELTEGCLLEDTDIVKEQIKKIKEMGIKIAIDDYGTGYSSLHYLKQLPVDSIKIDGSFVQTITDGYEDKVIVQSIIDLSKGLNKKVIAERVETRQQYDLLKKMGCDEVQGFLFSKAISASSITDMFLLDTVQPINQAPPAIERRKYYRVDFPLALSTQMTILSLNQKDLTLGSTEVLVMDIGLGGMRFTSHLRFTSQENIVYGFKTNIMETPIKLSGIIVWDQETYQDIFEYGIEFIIEEKERDKLASLINQLTLKLRSNRMFNNGDFITINPTAYLREKFM